MSEPDKAKDAAEIWCDEEGLIGGNARVCGVLGYRAGQAAAQAKAEERVAGLERENARLRQHIADEANRINIAGSAYDRAQAALDEIVTGLKMRARETLAVQP